MGLVRRGAAQQGGCVDRLKAYESHRYKFGTPMTKCPRAAHCVVTKRRSRAGGCVDRLNRIFIGGPSDVNSRSRRGRRAGHGAETLFPATPDGRELTSR